MDRVARFALLSSIPPPIPSRSYVRGNLPLVTFPAWQRHLVVPGLAGELPRG
jgi:hypothetical protein